jgi:hypothetical protein
MDFPFGILSTEGKFLQVEQLSFETSLPGWVVKPCMLQTGLH